MSKSLSFLFSDLVLYLMHPEDRFELPLGSFLGELTNELEDFGRDAYITEFVGAGPKNVSNLYLPCTFFCDLDCCTNFY